MLVIGLLIDVSARQCVRAGDDARGHPAARVASRLLGCVDHVVLIKHGQRRRIVHEAIERVHRARDVEIRRAPGRRRRVACGRGADRRSDTPEVPRRRCDLRDAMRSTCTRGAGTCAPRRPRPASSLLTRRPDISDSDDKARAAPGRVDRLSHVSWPWASGPRHAPTISRFVRRCEVTSMSVASDIDVTHQTSEEGKRAYRSRAGLSELVNARHLAPRLTPTPPATTRPSRSARPEGRACFTPRAPGLESPRSAPSRSRAHGTEGRLHGALELGCTGV